MTNSPVVYSFGYALSRDERSEAVVEKIRSFRELPDGWHYGEGVCATDTAVELALIMQATLISGKASEVEVFPDVSGGILVAGYYEEETVEIFCKHDGALSFVHEAGEEVDYARDNVSAQEAKEYVRELLWEVVKWRSVRSFGYFTQNTTAGRGRDLPVLRSRIPQRTVESRSSIPSVLESVVELNADTYFPSTTPMFQVNP